MTRHFPCVADIVLWLKLDSNTFHRARIMQKYPLWECEQNKCNFSRAGLESGPITWIWDNQKFVTKFIGYSVNKWKLITNDYSFALCTFHSKEILSAYVYIYNTEHGVELSDQISTLQKQPPEVFIKKGVLKNFTKFTEKYLCHGLFFNRVAVATLLKKRLWHRCFPVNFGKFSRSPFLQNTSGWLLLTLWSKFFERSISIHQN